jgi:adhesin transport system membrane fusion protein
MKSRPHYFLWVVGALLALFLAWAAWFEIDQSVRSQGQIILGARTQVIQAADGGVVSSIEVEEGQRVRAGQVLAKLEQERSRAAFDESRDKLASQEIQFRRLQAELTGNKPQFGPYATTHPVFVQAQQMAYQQRKESMDDELKTIAESMSLARQELEINKRLLVSGDVAQLDVMRAERQVLDLQTRRRVVLDKYSQEARQDLTKLVDERSSNRYKMESNQSVLQHTVMTAPIDGVVKQIKLTTIGGVLRQGDELMQIVPADDEALLELKINPADVGQLVTGLKANVRMDAFDSSIYGSLSGDLVYISPDTLVEQGPNGQQQTFYRARVRIAQPAGQARLQLRDIKPGMTATADILTGYRSVLFYLLKPINKSLTGAMSER